MKKLELKQIEIYQGGCFFAIPVLAISGMPSLLPQAWANVLVCWVT